MRDKHNVECFRTGEAFTGDGGRQLEEGLYVERTLTFSTALEKFSFQGVGGRGQGVKMEGGKCDGIGKLKRRAAIRGGAKRRRLEWGTGEKGAEAAVDSSSSSRDSTPAKKRQLVAVKVTTTTLRSSVVSDAKTIKVTGSGSGIKARYKPHPPTPNTLPGGAKFPTKVPPQALPSLLAHPCPLIDILSPCLLLVFIGTNPGLLTAYTTHTYASPTNRFWKLLHASNLTPTATGLPLHPSEDRTLPHRFLLGNTNIVNRATRSQEDLSREEMCAGADASVCKVYSWRPEAVCVVGKGVWEGFVTYARRTRRQQGPGHWGFSGGEPTVGKGFKWGWQVDQEGNEVRMGVFDELEANETKEGAEPAVELPERTWVQDHTLRKAMLPTPPLPQTFQGQWEGARVYVVPSTSGLVTMQWVEKIDIWKGLGEWVCKRRDERGFVCC